MISVHLFLPPRPLRETVTRIAPGVKRPHSSNSVTRDSAGAANTQQLTSTISRRDDSIPGVKTYYAEEEEPRLAHQQGSEYADNSGSEETRWKQKKFEEINILVPNTPKFVQDATDILMFSLVLLGLQLGELVTNNSN
jgi:hypothetical protein